MFCNSLREENAMRRREAFKLAVFAGMLTASRTAVRRHPAKAPPCASTARSPRYWTTRCRVTTADQGTVAIALSPETRIFGVEDRSLEDIRPGEFVGSAAVRGRDGKLHAQEVHIFPEALRGTGEGHRPFDQPEQTMTNATVDGVAEVTGGRTLHLRYPGGEQTIEVDTGVRVWSLIQGDRTLLVPGAVVTVRAVRGPGNILAAVSIQAEKSGIKPLP